MPNLLEMFKNLRERPLTEPASHDRQAFSIAARRAPSNEKLPSDEELAQMLNQEYVGKGPVSAETLFEMFFEISRETFFPSFRDQQSTMELFRQKFKGQSITRLLGRAEAIIEGKFDFPDFPSLELKMPIDWHFNPLSGRRFPSNHEKESGGLEPAQESDRTVVWQINRHRHFLPLGVTFLLTEEERYAVTFVRHLEDWMQQNPPETGINWLSSPEIALRSISWLWAFNFFKEAECFTPEIFLKSLKFLYLHARKLEEYLLSDERAQSNRTCAALGLYYLGTQLELFERSTRWRKMGDEILSAEFDRHFSETAGQLKVPRPDFAEAADFYTHFLILRALNESPSAGERDGKLKTRVQLLHDLLLYVARPNGTFPTLDGQKNGRLLCFSDTETDDIRPLLSTAAVLFERGDYKFAIGDWRQETLWLLGAEGTKKFEQMPAARPPLSSQAYSENGLYAMRDGWSPTDNYLLIDCGGAATEYGNAPAIEAACGGKEVLVSPHGFPRFADNGRLNSSVKARNSLTISEKARQAPPAALAAGKTNLAVDLWIAEDRFDFFSAEQRDFEHLSEAAIYRRSVLFLKNDYWIMRDFVETRGDHQYALNFQFDPNAKPELKKAADDFTFLAEKFSDESGWRMMTFGDNGRWERCESSLSTAFGRKPDAPFLRFVSEGEGAQEFFTFFFPLTDNFEKPRLSETSVAGGRIFVIDYRGSRDLFVFTDREQIVRTEIFNTNFQFHWARMEPAEQLPEEFVMIGGSNFSLGKREVINDPNFLKFAVARRLGNRLNVRTNETIFSVSLPKKQSSTFILKNILDS